MHRSNTQVEFATPQGIVTWVDGVPPTITVRESASGPPAEDGAARGPAPEVQPGAAAACGDFTLSLLWPAESAFPAPPDVLRSLDLTQVQCLRLVLRNADRPSAWNAARAWAECLERYLAQTRAALALRYELHAGLAEAPDALMEFAGPRLMNVTVFVTDTGRASEAWDTREQHAARLADWGVRVRPRLCLTRENRPHWEARAELWRTACHGAGVSFLRPAATADRPWEALAQLPPADVVSEFLSAIYDAGRQELRESYPFSWLLRALTAGTASLPQCGRPMQAAIDHSGRLFACHHRWPGGSAPAVAPCQCRYGPFCEALGGRCPRLRQAAGTDEWLRWERLYCATLQRVLPRMMADLATTARHQAFLAARPADERLCVAARDGQLSIRRQRVSTAS